MCLSPITIKNPNKNAGFKIGQRCIPIKTEFSKFKDTFTSTIQVPCGRCPQCVAMRQGFYNQRIQMESLRSHLFMFTLTYNDESLVHVDVGDYHYPIPVLSDIQNMFKRFRNDGHKFRVSYVTEYGKKHSRPHFHGIFAVDKSLGSWRTLERKYYKLFFNSWCRNIGSKRFPKYVPLFTPVYKRARCTTFDFHYIEPVKGHDSDVSYYVSKYITKYDQRTDKLLKKILLDASLSDDESSFLYKITKPRCITSKDFGDWRDPIISAYINQCAIKESAFRYPQFIDIYTGQQGPMSPYYGKHLDRFKALYRRFELSDLHDEGATVFFDKSTALEVAQSREHDLMQLMDFERKQKKLFNRLEF